MGYGISGILNVYAGQGEGWALGVLPPPCRPRSAARCLPPGLRRSLPACLPSSHTCSHARLPQLSHAPLRHAPARLPAATQPLRHAPARPTPNTLSPPHHRRHDVRERQLPGLGPGQLPVGHPDRELPTSPLSTSPSGASHCWPVGSCCRRCGRTARRHAAGCAAALTQQPGPWELHSQANKLTPTHSPHPPQFILWLNTFCLNGVLCLMMGLLTIQVRRQLLCAAPVSATCSCTYPSAGGGGWGVGL